MVFPSFKVVAFQRPFCSCNFGVKNNIVLDLSMECDLHGHIPRTVKVILHLLCPSHRTTLCPEYKAAEYLDSTSAYRTYGGIKPN